MNKYRYFAIFLGIAITIYSFPTLADVEAAPEYQRKISRASEIKYHITPRQFDLIDCYLISVKGMQNCSVKYMAGIVTCNAIECADNDFLCLLEKQSCQHSVEIKHVSCKLTVDMQYAACLE